MPIFGCSCALLLLAAAQPAPSQTAAPVPTFRVGTRLVQVDVVVRDKKGPAAGLTKEDFTVFDNGKPQEIVVFSVRSFSDKSFSIPSAPALAPAAVSLPRLPPGAVSNRLSRAGEEPASATVVLIDQYASWTDQAFANQRIVKFLETRRKQDRIGIYLSGGSGLHVVQDLTNDAELLSRAADSLKPHYAAHRDSDTTGMTGHAAEEYTQLVAKDRVTQTKHVFQAIARHLASVPGRKNLIWVTDSFCLCNPIVVEDMEISARALNDANVALYAVDARGLIGALGQMTGIPNAESRGPSASRVTAQQRNRIYSDVGPSGIETMNLLAGLTGGDVYFNTNGIEDSMQAAVEDADLTYTLGFYPAPESKDLDVHNLKVKVARSGVTVRYRENYSSPEKLAAVKVDWPTMERLLKDPLDATQIGLVAQAAPDQAHPGSYNVRVSVDPRDVKLENQPKLENQAAAWVGAIDVSFHVEGSKGARIITRKIRIPANQLAASLERPIVVETSIALEGPNGDLRIVVQDQTTGAAGSLRLPLGGK